MSEFHQGTFSRETSTLPKLTSCYSTLFRGKSFVSLKLLQLLVGTTQSMALKMYGTSSRTFFHLPVYTPFPAAGL